MSYILNKTTSVIPIGGVATLTGNTGGAVAPTVGNINIVGSGGVNVVGTPGSSTLTITAAGSTATTYTSDSGDAVPAANILLVVGGPGITTSGSGNTLTINSTEFNQWNEIVATSATMAVDQGYIANNVALVTLTLPAVAIVGNSVRVAGKGTGLWSIAQNAGQTIHFGVVSTTAGVGGSLSAIARYDCVELLCITENDEWLVTSSIGNLTVV